MPLQSILVLGLGKVGTLVGVLLEKTGFQVVGAARSEKTGLSFETKKIDMADISQVVDLMKAHDAVVSCLHYPFNLDVAKQACLHKIHYFDLTEDLPTTQAIIKLSSSADSILAPQCGLAPGFIAIVGASLAEHFDKVRNLRLRVGALPQHPTGLLGYAFNWSPEGVVNEYLNDCEVIENGVHKWVSPMEWVEGLVIDGIQLEAFTTSGGLGTMCETYLGVIENLDYKSIRCPGHVKLMNFFFHELLMRENRKMAGGILTNAKPPVKKDVVYVHASAEGQQNQQLVREEFVNAYYPVDIDGQSWSAISWTTAASLCAIVEMVHSGSIANKGFIKQEDIALEAFLKTSNGRLYNREPHGGSIAG
ncbi:saccharopine dehydrogenase family protein [Desulfosarcina sp.]|uniref:saccharopine dehydrogenase family protein n=1 Tax=Desulfosarcina sp. TaxID=2027861 RepID=UPI0029B90A9C|nr:saccharopine dehydrogenase C-terminal domain-containing protein [Desulfosarcina sp.]MDX2451238.1 saccharopine dehydrogenase C-terminal domain-containing protein [Desulfosarcina sp.]MDX2489068.1 saccharopine dehydrogenase C-terminal domain-containing protein [Desulfosarcina sp.]